MWNAATPDIVHCTTMQLVVRVDCVIFLDGVKIKTQENGSVQIFSNLKFFLKFNSHIITSIIISNI
jgi:hypothetical protein